MAGFYGCLPVWRASSNDNTRFCHTNCAQPVHGNYFAQLPPFHGVLAYILRAPSEFTLLTVLLV